VGAAGPLAVKREALDIHALEHRNPLAPGMLQKRLVELRTLDLKRMGEVAAQFAEVQGPLFGPPFQICPMLLLESGAFNLLPNPKQIQDREDRWKEGFPDMVAREVGPLQESDLDALSGQEGGCRGAAGAAADNQDVGGFGDAIHVELLVSLCEKKIPSVRRPAAGLRRTSGRRRC